MDGGRAGGGESEFLLSLLNKRRNQHETPSQQSSSASPLPSLASPFTTPLPHYHSRQQQKQHNKQSVVLDPAVAAADGPNVPFLPSWPSDGRDLPSSSRPKKFSPPFHPNFKGFPQSPLPRNQLQGNHFRRSQQVDDLKILGPLGNSTTHSYSQHKQPEHEQPQKLLGLLEQKPVFPYLMQRNGSELNVNSLHDSKSRSYVGGSGSGRNMNRQFNSRSSNGGSNTSYVGDSELDHLTEQLVNSLVVGDDKNGKKQHRNSHQKDSRSDTRGKYILSQRMRTLRRQTVCRRDIDSLNAPFLLIYESLIPPEEVKAKQKQLLMLLEKLVEKEWPQAKLYLYGSCANSFGVSKSDIDVCLAMEDEDINKSEVLLKLADILQSDNFQNVQALTRARVPIVKLMDPETGISCDICVNNILAVVNTKLLRDYACIDERLRQLAFIVKHWAKSRGVNETYQGTLSSYAYVLMCIHFLQLRRPAILPCLQEMETTCSVTVDDIDCTFFDQVEKLCGFGSRNKETIAQLVWAFFNYWAYYHDYANDVISVRSGSIISKHEKDWTRRIGNDRHLICIEDPFELSHDLGRVVDKFSIRILREEFERAAEVMQYDRNPCVRLFEPYVPF